ncbi:polysaccharide deacetylase family protein [Ferruginibacter albus]|uniref:polysaccharide deacetylase family protein n=1 Tax=Ferruginibacter albus TaxID=2875540 RepID=UPI001CC710CC|nr:polysaccharide deacetylase family protein [Ferruginibacter albus]UAY51832.1 polysaccharide deacetylase family protein [Ferruginibacter albus]
MNQGSEAEQAASIIFKNIFITVVLSACHYRENETTTTVHPIKISHEDTTVKVAVKPAPKKKKRKTLYLTFDDGPNKGTRKVMHIAEKEQIPITMFIIGEHVYASREQTTTFDSLVQCKMIELENHSFSHAFNNRYVKFYTCSDSAVKDFIRCADSLHLTDKIVRTPGRNIWRTENITATDIKASTATADSLRSKGFTAIGWDLEWHFDKNLKLESTSDEVLQQIDSVFAKGKTKTPDQLVLLAHDQVYADADDSSQLSDLVKKLKAKDEYDFDIISNYPGLK